MEIFRATICRLEVGRTERERERKNREEKLQEKKKDKRNKKKDGSACKMNHQCITGNFNLLCHRNRHHPVNAPSHTHQQNMYSLCVTVQKKHSRSDCEPHAWPLTPVLQRASALAAVRQQPDRQTAMFGLRCGERPIPQRSPSHCSINYSQEERANKGPTYEHPWTRDGSMGGKKKAK